MGEKTARRRVGAWAALVAAGAGLALAGCAAAPDTRPVQDELDRWVDKVPLSQVQRAEPKTVTCPSSDGQRQAVAEASGRTAEPFDERALRELLADMGYGTNSLIIEPPTDGYILSARRPDGGSLTLSARGDEFSVSILGPCS